MEKGLPKKRLRVNWQLCRGCGLCTSVCPREAVSLVWGKAWIDQRKCVLCHQCEKTCPFGAIREEVPVLVKDFSEEITELRHQADDLIHRLAALTRKGGEP